MKHRLLLLLLVVLLTLGMSGQALAIGYTGGTFSGLLRNGDNLLVTDVYNKVIWQMTSKGQVVYAGKSGVPDLSGEPTSGYYDGTLKSSLFASPWAIAPYLDGYAVTDAGNNVVRYISEKGVRTVAGSSTAGFQDGLGTNARFNHPTGLVADSDGSLYVADTGNNVIRKITRTGQVSTYATGFWEPTGLCWQAGTLYVADSGHNCISKVVNGTVSIIAGSFEGLTASDGVYEGDYVDGTLASARFSNPQGVAVAVDGTIYVADTGNSAVRKISGGRVSTILAPAKGDSETFPVSPRGLLLDSDSIYVSDVFAQEVRVISLTSQAPTYSDVSPNSWYFKAVSYVSNEGLLNGTSNGFEPESALNRAMAATLISRLYGKTHPSQIITGHSVFNDVAEGAWYRNAIAWAADQGITKGTGSGFDPNRAVTRQELACFLYRFARLTGMNTSNGVNTLTKFPDSGKVDTWAREPMTWATSNGIFKGDQSGYLNPGGTVTRAQTAQILQNLVPLLP